MSTWYSKDLGDSVAAFEPTTKMQDAFMALTVSGEHTPEIAIFSIRDLERKTLTVYFPPAAEALAKEFDAGPCEMPTPKQNFSLLAGTADSWNVYFPGFSERKIRLDESFT